VRNETSVGLSLVALSKVYRAAPTAFSSIGRGVVFRLARRDAPALAPRIDTVARRVRTTLLLPCKRVWRHAAAITHFLPAAQRPLSRGVGGRCARLPAAARFRLSSAGAKGPRITQCAGASQANSCRVASRA
jgi:hypothetical protein